jgi:uncharacterized integral membrane protein
MSFDPTPDDKNISEGPTAFTRETVRITPARIGWAALAVLTLIFVIQNGDRVDFRFVVLRADQVPLWMVIVIAVALGFALGLLTASLRRRRRKDRQD